MSGWVSRGLYARWLLRGIAANGWHRYLRLNRQGQFRLAGQARWRDLHSVVPVAGRSWAGAITCFKGPAGRVDGTLLARGETGQAEPWLVVTDLAADAAQSAWYGLRSWIEAGFKDRKRGGWQWEQTKVREPGRAERQWLVIAVATLWVGTVGRGSGGGGRGERVGGAGGLQPGAARAQTRERGALSELFSAGRDAHRSRARAWDGPAEAGLLAGAGAAGPGPRRAPRDPIQPRGRRRGGRGVKNLPLKGWERGVARDATAAVARSAAHYRAALQAP